MNQTKSESRVALGTTVVVGDLHGRLSRLEGILAEHGEDATYLFVGDYLDRWHDAPGDGYNVMRRIMTLANANCLLGNHDALILAVLKEQVDGPDPRLTERGWTGIGAIWIHNGGNWADLRALADDPAAVNWLHSLDGMAVVGDTLVQHADTPNYIEYGTDVASVNDGLRASLIINPYRVFAHLTDRRRFRDLPVQTAEYVERFGVARLVHGHTAHRNATPEIYNEGLCVCVDSNRGVAGAVLRLN